MHRPALTEPAPAKVNLTLRIAGRRPDGYHDLTSLVAFADIGDELHLRVGDALQLSVTGAGAKNCGPEDDNLVLKAARVLQAQAGGLRTGHFHLDKRLPVAAGLGGGSSDAAAALRLIARANDLDRADPRLMAAACATGADVPVCLAARARIMRGIGERLSAPLRLPPLPAVLAFPGVAAPTATVFAQWAKHRDAATHPDDAALAVFESRNAITVEGTIAALKQSGNDLEAPAIALFPVIGEALAALKVAPGCRLARMSGSGSACFGLFDSAAAAGAAAAELEKQRPDWWIRAVRLNG